MTKSKKPSQGWLSWAQCVLFVGVLVGGTLFHVWQKVEMARVASAIHTAQTRSVDLGKERAKLLAAVAIKKNPVYIERVAVAELGMVHPPGGISGSLARWEGE